MQTKKARHSIAPGRILHTKSLHSLRCALADDTAAAVATTNDAADNAAPAGGDGSSCVEEMLESIFKKRIE